MAAPKSKSRSTSVSVTYGANQSEKRFVLKAQPRTSGSGSVISKFAEQAVIRKPRVFAEPERSQRHLATAVGSYLRAEGDKQFQEIQVGRTKGGLMLSSNHNTSNAALSSLITKKKTMRGFIKEVTKPSKGDSAREGRHKEQLSARWETTFAGRTALTVPEPEPSAMNGLHAERRIDKAGGTHIVGIKRRCAHCFNELGPISKDDRSGLGPGPEWLSGAAKLGKATPSTHLTRVTEVRDESKKRRRYTVDYGSESESDDSLKPVKKRFKPDVT